MVPGNNASAENYLRKALLRCRELIIDQFVFRLFLLGQYVYLDLGYCASVCGVHIKLSLPKRNRDVDV